MDLPTMMTSVSIQIPIDAVPAAEWPARFAWIDRYIVERWGSDEVHIDLCDSPYTHVRARGHYDTRMVEIDVHAAIERYVLMR